MTQEEKAKAYDEALERARKMLNMILDNELLGFPDQIREIFPQLKESEDERIRKEISNLYSDIDGCITELLKARTNKDSEAEGKALFKMEGIMVGTLQDLSCIEDYLEKQKEQKPAEWNEEDNIGWEEAFACVTRTEKAAKNEEELQNAVTAEKWLKEIKFKYYVHPIKQELSEEDKDMLNSCISSIEEAKENRYAYKETDGDTSYDHEIAWLKSLPGRFVLQPKQEWSEDDERVIRDACNWIVEYAGFLVSENKDKAEMLWKLSNKLKSLCPQSKQEWSDKDDHILNNIYDFVAENTIDINRARCAKECLDWLKSLRPQPKAELTLLDENIIEAAVAFVEQNDHFNCWGGIDKRTVIKALHSLKSSWKPSEECLQ